MATITETPKRTFAGGHSERLAALAINFYGANYEVIYTGNLSPGRKRFLGAKSPRQCRFCGRQPPEVSFKKEAHAISGLTGNRVLFGFEECDDCNTHFGYLEDDFAKFTLPARLFGQVSGRKGIPKTLIPSGRMEMRDSVLRVEIDREALDVTFRDDPSSRSVTVSVPIQPYRPLGVYKALLKMALTIAPQEELVAFDPALRWLMSVDLQENLVSDGFNFVCIRTYGAKVYKFPTVRLLRRKPDSDAPYATFILGFGNCTYQIFLPGGELDRHLWRADVALQAFPPPQMIFGKAADDWAKFEVISLASPDKVVGSIWSADLNYQRREDPPVP